MNIYITEYTEKEKKRKTTEKKTKEKSFAFIKKMEWGIALNKFSTTKMSQY